MEQEDDDDDDNEEDIFGHIVMTAAAAKTSASDFTGTGDPKFSEWIFEIELAIKIAGTTKEMTDEQQAYFLLSKTKGEAQRLLRGHELKDSDKGKWYDLYKEILKQAYDSKTEKFKIEEEFWKLKTRKGEAIKGFASRVTSLANEAFEGKKNAYRRDQILAMVKRNIPYDYDNFVNIESIDDLTDLINEIEQYEERMISKERRQERERGNRILKMLLPK